MTDTKLRPPKSLEDVESPLGRRFIERHLSPIPRVAVDDYVREYNRGWAASRRGADTEFGTGYSTDAYDDGYLDASAGRQKWHLTYCTDHDNCGEG